MILPNVSIVVLSSNNDGINIVLDSIIPQLNNQDELIIVDDHTESELLSKINEYLSFKIVTILHSKPKGNRSHNRNLGAKVAKNNIVIFIDGDMVPDENAILNFKMAHNFRIECAFVGQTHATRYSEIPLQLFSGINNYLELITTPNGRKTIYENDIFADNRYSFLTDPYLKDYYWLLYYSGVCSVEKEVFIKAGGFDENFTQWGAEDVDLGYKISKLGKIGFLPDVHSIHIPHKRDILFVETSNYNNLIKLYLKYRTWEWEFLLTFKADTETLKRMLYAKNQMALLKINKIINNNENNAAYINTISQEHPNGLIEYNIDGKTIEYESIGISLAQLPRCINSIYINDNVFIYPSFIYCKILQEALTISKNVYIVKTEQTIRITEFSKKNHRTDNQLRIKYNSQDIMEYQYKSINGTLIKVTSKIKFSEHINLEDTGE